MELIRFENVSFCYSNENNVLSNISFSLKDNGLVIILGESGSGKSTLLSLMNHSLVPTSGKIIKKEGVRISTSFQSPTLLDYLNVKENVALPLYLKDEKDDLIDEEVDNALLQVDMLDKKERDIKNLSGGEKMRVSIARALVNKSNILILDEPTGALDDITTKEIYSLIKNLSEKMLIVLVTHDEKGAYDLAEILYELKEGRLNLVFNKEKENKKEIEIVKEDNRYISYKKGMLLNLKYLLKHKIRIMLCVIFLSLSFSFQYIGMNIFFNIDNTLTKSMDMFYSSSTAYLSRVEQVETSSNLKLEKVSLPAKKDLQELGVKKVRSSLDYFIPQYQEIYLNNISGDCYFFPVVEEDKTKLKEGEGILSSVSIVVNSLFVKMFKIEDSPLNQKIYFNHQFIVNDDKEEISDLCNLELTFIVSGVSKESSSFSKPIIYYSYEGIYQSLNKIRCENISKKYDREVSVKEMLETYSLSSCDLNSRSYVITDKEILQMKEKIEEKNLKLKLNSLTIEIYDSTKEVVTSITKIIMVYLLLFIILSTLLLFLSTYSLYENNIKFLALVKVFSLNNKKNNFIITFSNVIIVFLAIYSLFALCSVLNTIVASIAFKVMSLPNFIKIIDIKSAGLIFVLLIIVTSFTSFLARQKIKDKRIKKELDGED